MKSAALVLAALALATACNGDDDADADASLAVTLDNLATGTWLLAEVRANGVPVPGTCPQEITFTTASTLIPGEAALTCRPFIAGYDANGNQVLDPVDVDVRGDSLIVDPDLSQFVGGFNRYAVDLLTAQRLELAQEITSPAGAFSTRTVFVRQ